MSRRRKLTLAAGVALVVIAAVWLWPRAKGPTHEGKTVEEWFHSYYETFGPAINTPESFWQKKHAQKAFRTFGTNAVPYLASRITQNMDYSKVERWRIKLDDAVPSPLKPWGLRPRQKEFEAGLAANLLSEQIHPPAEMLLPLLKLAFQSTNETQQRDALFSLTGEAAPVWWTEKGQRTFGF